MDALDALTAAVIARPDDDLPRLVLADCLEESGQSDRAEFIRTQIDLANTPDWEPLAVRLHTFDPATVAGTRWLDTLPRTAFGVEWLPTAFRRGFGWAVRLTNLIGLLGSGGELFDYAPVGELYLPTAAQEEWQAVGRSGWLPRVQSVRFFGTKTPIEAMRMFAESPLATGLQHLHFNKSGGPGLDDLVSGLMQSAVGRQLRSLTFEQGDHRWLPDLLDALSAGPEPPPLETLRFRTMPLAAPTAEQLAASPAVDQLTELELTNTILAGGGLRPLVESPRLRNVQSLTLRGCRLTAADVETLAAAPGLANLRRLDLSDNPLGAEAVAALSESPHLGGLRSLRLRRAGLDNESAARLTLARFWDRLVELDLGQNWLSDLGAKALTTAERPPELTAIRLDGNSFLTATQTALEMRFGGRLLLARGE